MQLGGKLCLVDGASLEHMVREEGVKFICARALFVLLRDKIGKVRGFSQPPIITLKPGLASPDHTIGNVFRRVGFEVADMDRYNEADDYYIEVKICGAKPAAVQEIVVVSSDHRYIEPLRKKLAQGIKVIWAAADVYQGGHPMIGHELRECLKGEFQFFDLIPQIRRLEFRLQESRRR